MNHKRPPIPVIVLFALVLIAGAYFGIHSLLNKSDNTLSASGTIEVVEITLSPEIGGKVAEVFVAEGDLVQAGDPLFRLDDTLLQAQRSVAKASLDLATAAASTTKRAQEVAETNYALVLNAARLESASSRTSDWRSTNPPGYTLPGGYFSRNEQLVAAMAAVEVARSDRDAVQTILNDLVVDPGNQVFSATEMRLDNARASFLVAQDVINQANLSTNSDLRDVAQSHYDAAKAELELAQSAYDELKNTESAQAIIKAREELSVAEQLYQMAQDRVLILQTGVDSPKVVAAQATVNQSVQAAAQSQSAIAQGEASLRLIDLQISKLTVTSPAEGIILTRSIQPGETVATGARAITLGRLTELTITVYIPEDRYGELSLGQSASVMVDSFPGLTFNATIIHIADQAEFTPRNVQTVEGRASTVFAIHLQVYDDAGKLKPGMPADVVFSSGN